MLKCKSNMLPDVEAAVRLHDIDGRIAVLQKEIAALPKHIAEIEKKLSSHERRLEIDRSALSANQKERKRLEGEIQLAEGKISKLRSQALEAKTNEHYRAFQNEIDYATKEIRSCEDRILELMTASEPLDVNVKGTEAALKDERKQRGRAESRSGEARFGHPKKSGVANRRTPGSSRQDDSGGCEGLRAHPQDA